MVSRTRATRASLCRWDVVSYAAPSTREAVPPSPARARPRPCTQRTAPPGSTTRYSTSKSPQRSTADWTASITRVTSSGCNRAVKSSMLCSKVARS